MSSGRSHQVHNNYNKSQEKGKALQLIAEPCLLKLGVSFLNNLNENICEWGYVKLLLNLRPWQHWNVYASLQLLLLSYPSNILFLKRLLQIAMKSQYY